MFDLRIQCSFINVSAEFTRLHVTFDSSQEHKIIRASPLFVLARSVKRQNV